MDVANIIERLSANSDCKLFIESTAKEAAKQINEQQLKLLDLVRLLDPILTNGNHEVRSKGVNLLSLVIISIPKDLLSEQMINVLSEFLTMRLIDHKSMENASLQGLLFFINCPNKPKDYNKTLLEFLKDKSNIRRMDAKNRHLIYEIISKIVDEKLRQSKSMFGELIYNVISLMEEENNPENLILCFAIISNILKNFTDLEPYIEDIFEWLSSYYPLEYTPPTSDGDKEQTVVRIHRSDLIDALYECFYANEANVDCLFEILLEKLDSTVLATKLESLECLIKCYKKFPLNAIKKFNSTVWTAIRSSCLRSSDLIEQKYLNLSLKTLNSLANRMSEDRELHILFLTDMYEELAIAFRKPEMNLFEPAAKLITQVALPNITCFNYILEKILPISLNAIAAGELKPLSGLAYIFEQLHNNYQSAKLKADFNTLVQKLSVFIVDYVGKEESALKLLNSLICNQTFDLDNATIEKLVFKLHEEYKENSSLNIEMCLSQLCLNYKQLELVNIKTKGYELDDLLQAIDTINNDSSSNLTICLYLRLLIIKLHDATGEQLNQLNNSHPEKHLLRDFLCQSRNLASQSQHRSDKNLVEKVAQLHGIILNKLKNDSVSPIMMDLFSSDYCQKLIPMVQSSSDEKENAKLLSINVYLPIVSWTFKSLVIRNHQLFTPLVNLLLNFITSDQVDSGTAMFGVQLFSFILSDNCTSDDEYLLSLEKHYQRFLLYKQKFYMQTSKEIKIRYDKESTAINMDKRQLLLCSLALQVPHLPVAVYKRDINWLLRELIRVLSTSTARSEENEDLLNAIFTCLGNLMQQTLTDQLTSFLSSLIDLNLKYAQEAKALSVRRTALICLSKIAQSFKHSELLVYRPITIDKLRLCLTDKKRLVRQAAAETRLRWVLIGQPIGS